MESPKTELPKEASRTAELKPGNRYYIFFLFGYSSFRHWIRDYEQSVANCNVWYLELLFCYSSPAFVIAAKAAARAKKSSIANPEIDEFVSKAVTTAKKATAAASPASAAKKVTSR